MEPHTRIFLDSGDARETRKALDEVGFLDGQTTNPSLVAKNDALQMLLRASRGRAQQAVLEAYRQIAQEISALIPHGSVSLEVPADAGTSSEEMHRLALELFSWIPNAHIKLPINNAGLESAAWCVRDGLRVNMTLCFSQRQAAIVHAATEGAERGQVFISPFVGRLDDRGLEGMSLVRNILRMYKTGNSHVEVLTASVRTVGHLVAAIMAGSDIVTAPLVVLRDWAALGMPKTAAEPAEAAALENIPFENIDLGGQNLDWRAFDVRHNLTDIGLERFAQDWNNIL